MSLSDLANVATVFLGISAVVALGVAGWQVRAMRWQTRQAHRHQLEAVARTHYQDFVRLCVQYPQYSVAQLLDTKLDMEARTFDGDHIKFYEYEWFYVAGFNALEIIYSTVGIDGPWKNTILSIAREHRKYIRSARYDEIMRPTVDPGFLKLIDDEVRNHAGDEPIPAQNAGTD